jgi:hypothetical protein
MDGNGYFGHVGYSKEQGHGRVRQNQEYLASCPEKALRSSFDRVSAAAVQADEVIE